MHGKHRHSMSNTSCHAKDCLIASGKSANEENGTTITRSVMQEGQQAAAAAR